MKEHYIQIYETQAEDYQRLIGYEDHEENVIRILGEIFDWRGREGVELGAGTGRLTCMLAPLLRSLRCFDAYGPMLEIAKRRCGALGLMNVSFELAEHKSIPLGDGVADVVFEGWSFGHLLDSESPWEEMESAMLEARRLLRPGGTLLLVETLGTGQTEPSAPSPVLAQWFEQLESEGFQSAWCRTDYRFDTFEEGSELTRFFFGEGKVSKIIDGEEVILPECTGFWWRSFE